MAMTRNGDQYSASSPLPENSVAAIALSIVAILWFPILLPNVELLKLQIKVKAYVLNLGGVA